MARRTRWLTSETRSWTLAISGATLLVVLQGRQSTSGFS